MGDHTLHDGDDVAHDGTRQKALMRLRSKLMFRSNEIILGLLITICLAVVGFGFTRIMCIEDRVWAAEQETARNTERIIALQESINRMEKWLTKELEQLSARVEKRCDRLEDLLKFIVSTVKKEDKNGFSNSKDGNTDSWGRVIR